MVRLFITWFAEPEDPHYWRFFSIDGLVVSMKSILALRGRSRSLFNVLISRGFRSVYGYGGALIIDSMLSSLHGNGGAPVNMTQSQVLYLQYLIGSDVLVHMDYPIINVDDEETRRRLLRRNIVNAEAALRFAESLGKDVMLVVQGWDEESYAECAGYYRDLGVKYVGVGSLVPHSNDPEFLVRVVSRIREIIGSGAYIHVFGVGNVGVLRLIGRYVDSVDISTPAIAGGKKEVIIPSDGGFRRVRVTSIMELAMLKERLEVSNDEVERLLITNIISAKTLREKNRSVITYNTYVLSRYWRKYMKSL